MADIATRIKQLRNERGITQTELAAKLGTERSCVSNWETRKRMPRAAAVSAMSSYFGVSADYMCGRVDSKNTVIAPPTFRMDITKLNYKGQEQLNLFYKFLLTIEEYTD